jgi:integrase
MARWDKVQRYIWRSGSRYRVRLKFRTAGGWHVLQQTAESGGLPAALDVLPKLLARRKAIRNRSLTGQTARYSTFGALIEFYRQRRQPRSMETVYGVLKRDLGAVALEELPERFDQFLQILRSTCSESTGRPRTESTMNRYIAAAKIVLNFAAKLGKVTGLQDNPLRGFSCTRELGRDRVWSAEERRRIFAALADLKSYLYWPVYFCQWNPIRRGDLFRLTRDNLDREGKRIHFYPSKTRHRVNRETFLPFIDKALWDYFDSLPADCPFLFPRLLRRRGKVVGWHQVTDPDTHWHTVLRQTEVRDPVDETKVAVPAVADFHWHDLKHCAVTWMLDSGYTEVDIKALGIQYDHEMVMRYAHREVGAVQARWQEAQTVVAGSIAPKAVATA